MNTMFFTRYLRASRFYSTEANYSLQLNRWMLKPLGAWPHMKSPTLMEKLLSFAIILTCYGILAFTIIPTILYMFLEETDMQKRLKIIGPLGHWVSGMLDYSSILMHTKDVKFCVAHMQADWKINRREKDREIMMAYAKLGRYAAGFYSVFMHFGAFSYITILACNIDHVFVDNQTVDVHRIPFPIYKKFVNTNLRPANEIVIASQYASCFVVNSVIVGACSLAAVFAMHACGQLKLLEIWMNEFVQQATAKKGSYLNNNNVSGIVEHHLRTLTFISSIEQLMNQICFVELLGCTAQICMIGYYVIMEWDELNVQASLTYCVIFISVSFNILTFCYIGDMLKEQCIRIGDSIYMTEWYYLPHKTALDFILIISTSNRVIKITAGKLVQLSVSTFGDVMKTSVAYLNILRAMTT